MAQILSATMQIFKVMVQILSATMQIF